jgi:hypothetical protein
VRRAQMAVNTYAANAAPVALVDASRNVATGAAVELDAGRSFDPDGNRLVGNSLQSRAQSRGSERAFAPAAHVRNAVLDSRHCGADEEPG